MKVDIKKHNMELIKIETPELELIEKSKSKQIRETFEPMVKMLESFEEVYLEILTEAKNEINTEITNKAKRLRIDIGKVRIETGKIKDKQKEYIKLEDKAIMGVHNILVWAVKEKEDKLKEIETHFEIQEQKRLNEIQIIRENQIADYIDDVSHLDLASMDDDVWQAYFTAKKQAYSDRIEAEKKAEEDRIAREKAEAEEREMVRIENEKLKAEAEAREKERLIELKKQEEQRQKVERERKRIEEENRKQQEELQRKIKEEELKRIEAERKIKEEQEREEREEAERKRIEEEKIQNELNKNDTQKVKDLLNDLNSLKTKYVFNSKKNTKMYNEVSILIDKIINHIEK